MNIITTTFKTKENYISGIFLKAEVANIYFKSIPTNLKKQHINILQDLVYPFYIKETWDNKTNHFTFHQDKVPFKKGERLYTIKADFVPLEPGINFMGLLQNAYKD